METCKPPTKQVHPFCLYCITVNYYDAIVHHSIEWLFSLGMLVFICVYLHTCIPVIISSVSAIEKAMAYTETGELPWNMELDEIRKPEHAAVEVPNYVPSCVLY